MPSMVSGAIFPNESIDHEIDQINSTWSLSNGKTGVKKTDQTPDIDNHSNQFLLIRIQIPTILKSLEVYLLPKLLKNYFKLGPFSYLVLTCSCKFNQ